MDQGTRVGALRISLDTCGRLISHTNQKKKMDPWTTCTVPSAPKNIRTGPRGPTMNKTPWVGKLPKLSHKPKTWWGSWFSPRINIGNRIAKYHPSISTKNMNASNFGKSVLACMLMNTAKTICCCSGQHMLIGLWNVVRTCDDYHALNECCRKNFAVANAACQPATVSHL